MGARRRTTRHEEPPSDAVLARIFPGAGEMARRMREVDWSQTPVGPVTTWPASLTTAVGIVLSSRYPMFIWWGERALTYFYNDAYVSILAGKHPRALGASGAETWPEVWPTIGPLVDAVFKEGRSTWSEELPLTLERSGYREEMFVTFSYSPIFDDGRIAGLFCACFEDTRRVIAERRLKTQRALAADVVAARDVDQVCAKAVEHLASNPYDLPFVLLYLLDDAGRTARLVASAGLDASAAFAFDAIAVGDDGDPWDFAGTLHAGGSQLAFDLRAAFGGRVPRGLWDDPPTQALVVPLARPGSASSAGFAVFGLSPRRLFDDDYRGFCELLAGHVATGLVNARAYHEERARAEALAELDRAKTTFFSNVSHEFRTPLTLMLGPIEDTLASGKLRRRERERLSIAHRNSLRLLKLVNTLLDFSRIEAGRLEACYEETDVGAATAELASIFRAAVDRAGLTLDVECRPPAVTAFVDREMWEKIVLNLLSNAFKFTFEGGIRVCVEQRGERVALSVADTGTGIPAEELPHVFERFHRVRGSEGRTHEGTGIGLALVQELVKLHGGTVAAESVLGRGTTVTVEIPTGAAHLPAERVGHARTLRSTARGAAPYVEEALRWLPEVTVECAADALEFAGSGRVSTAGARVLVADDNRDLRDYLRRLLSTHWSVECVSDGAAALLAVKARRPELVLSDIMMPKLDGIGLLRAIRDDPALRTLPVILLSAHAGEQAHAEGLDAGADDYLTKPFAARELVARVNAHIELARRREGVHAQLSASEERYRSLVEATALIVWRAGPDGGVVDAPRWQAFTGQTADEVAGMGWLDAVHPDDRAATVAVWREAQGTKAAVTAEHRLRTVDGTYHRVLVRAVPVLDAAGAIQEWIGTVVDIQEERHAQQQVASLNQRLAATVRELEAVLDTAPVGIWFARDPACRVIEGNRTANAMFGIASGNVSPAAARDERAVELRLFRDGVELAPSEMPLMRAVATGFPVIGEELEVQVNGGARLDLIVGAVPLFAPDGGVRGGVAAAADVSAQRASAREREELLRMAERARREAERANHAKDDFLSVLSHELRTPMNAILGWLHILKAAGDPEMIDRATETIERNVWVQSQVINDLLDVSRIMSGKLQLEHERVDVASAVMATVESVRPSADAKGIRLRLRIEAQDLEVIGDGARLQQIVGNLLANAVKFTESGGVTVTVEGDEGAVRVVVEDTGQGIEPDFLPHIFERFRQADSSTARRHGGLGLGLAIVKNVVAMHGGSVEAESAGRDQGARFTVSLPRAQRAPRRSAPVRRAAVSGPGPSKLTGVDVVLVEDDADSRMALEIALDEHGAKVRSVASVRQALEAYDERPPDVLVSDIGMAGEDGYELIRMIRDLEAGRDHRTLAIAITGFASRQDREAALRAGFDEHVGKPIEPAMLCERVRLLRATRAGGASSPKRPTARRRRSARGGRGG